MQGYLSMMRNTQTKEREMIVVLLHNHFDSKHLAEVIEEMKEKGPPTIRVIDKPTQGKACRSMMVNFRQLYALIRSKT